VREGRVRAVYDMDSVALGDELSLLAGIAVHYSYTGEPGGSWPSREEAAAFVADYERVRARPFSPAERERLDAGAIYAMAHTARLQIPTSPDAASSRRRTRWPSDCGGRRRAGSSRLERPPGVSDPLRGHIATR
jgi:hypothetical protein